MEDTQSACLAPICWEAVDMNGYWHRAGNTGCPWCRGRTMRWLGAVLLLVLAGVNVARFSFAPATVAPSPMDNTGGSQHQRNTEPHSSRQQHDARQQQEVEGSTDKRLVLQGQASGKHEGTGSFMQLETLNELQQPGSCRDYHIECPKWAKQHICRRNPDFMRLHCTFSCGACAGQLQREGSGVFDDAGTGGSRLGAAGAATGQAHDRDANDVDLSDVDVYSTGIGANNDLPGLHSALVPPPSPPPPIDAHNQLLPPPLDVVLGKGSEVYMRGRELGSNDGEWLDTRQLLYMPRVPCKDKEGASCLTWADHGECSSNPDYMAASCAASCNHCQVLWTDRPLAAVQLRSGHVIPTIGYGTATLKERTKQAVLDALAAGYRLLDSAQANEWYREADVGAALSTTHIPREQLFVITKVHPRDFAASALRTAVAGSLSKLNTTYLDLVLLHYPKCWVGLAGCKSRSEVEEAGATWQDAWRTLEALQLTGHIRSLGVSNFNALELQQLMAFATVAPSVLEARCDPFDCPPHLVNAALKAGLAFIAYSPLGAQWAMQRVDGRNPVLEHPIIKGWAAKLLRSPAQLVLRWALQRGAIVIPCSSNRTHMDDNLKLHDFVLPLRAMQDMNLLQGYHPPI